MQPGLYTITVKAKGFKKAEQQNINLLANTSPRVDVTLQPGNVSETVVVTTAPPVLQTDRADISTKIEAQAVMELPLTTNRNYQSLLNLVPGVAPAVFQHSQFFNAATPFRLKPTACRASGQPLSDRRHRRRRAHRPAPDPHSSGRGHPVRRHLHQ